MTGKSSLAVLFLGVAIGVAGLAIFSPSWGPASPPTVRTVDNVLPSAPAAPPTEWPDYRLSGPGFQTPAMADGELIAYGHKLVTQTFALIGPEAADPAKRFAGNNFSCQNCHLDGGTNRTALPLVGVAKTYPKFSPRNNRVLSLTERLDDCMTRSMNGQPLPADSREMKALVAYLEFITEPAPMPTEPAPAPPQPANASRGLTVYETACAACHHLNGQGVRIGSANEARGYRFPPLWGADSFNDGAGMNTFHDAVGFVWRNMPHGVDPRHPQLTLQQAWDVVAYLKTMPRPKDPSAH